MVTATLRADRTKNCPLPAEKDLKKGGRGSHSFRTDANSGITATKWYDNKCVQLISNHCCNPQETNKIKRWDRGSQTYTEINCPTVVEEYNKSMGGVDLADMLISLYRTTIKTKRWYVKVLFHCVDIAKVNGWLLYRRHCDQRNVPKKSQLSLLKFTISVASALNPQTPSDADLWVDHLPRQQMKYLPQGNASYQQPFWLMTYGTTRLITGQNFGKRKISADIAKQEQGVSIAKNAIFVCV